MAMVEEALKSVAKEKGKEKSRELSSVRIKKAENGYSVDISYETKEIKDGKEETGYKSEDFVATDLDDLTVILKKTLGDGSIKLSENKENKEENENKGNEKKDTGMDRRAKRKEIAKAVVEKYMNKKEGE